MTPPAGRSSADALALFAAQAERPDAAIELAEAALLVAEVAEPGLDRPACQHQLDELAARFRARLAATTSGERAQPARAGELLADLLHRESGFRGNAADYYDPRNSYLNAVLERRLGIPITLSIVYLEVARRAGLPAEGVGFPGHFLVRVGRGSRGVLLDPFEGGRLLDHDDLLALLRQHFGPDVRLVPGFLDATAPRQILYRLLNNLKAIHARAGADERTLSIMEMIVALVPERPEERRDRGLLRVRLERPAEALDDLQWYLDSRAEAEDAGSIGQLVVEIRAGLARWN